MPNWDVVDRHHVFAAIAEYDRLGGEGFLSTYGFGPSRGYVLVHADRSYDSKAILGSRRIATPPEQLPRRLISWGGKSGAARVLRNLDFDVTDPGDHEALLTGSYQPNLPASASPTAPAVCPAAWRYPTGLRQLRLISS